MQNDFMNAFNSLVIDLEQQLNELQATIATKDKQIEQLLKVNQELMTQNEMLNDENNRLVNTNAKQNSLLKTISEKFKLK